MKNKLQNRIKLRNYLSVLYIVRTEYEGFVPYNTNANKQILPLKPCPIIITSVDDGKVNTRDAVLVSMACVHRNLLIVHVIKFCVKFILFFFALSKIYSVKRNSQNRNYNFFSIEQYINGQYRS